MADSLERVIGGGVGMGVGMGTGSGKEHGMMVAKQLRGSGKYDNLTQAQLKTLLKKVITQYKKHLKNMKK